uniref:1-acyl-sn-glycerol-3-phosphate acyltransferase n=1 Tax=Syphacia muris TaxID=451379 RepID=A0A0N5AEJ6_9BILA
MIQPAKFVYNTLYVLGSWTGLKCDIRGESILQRESPFVLVVNHQVRIIVVFVSSLDMKVLSAFWPKQCTVMMKRSLIYVPFFGFVALLCRSIFVDRFNHKRAHESLLKSAELIRDKKLSLAVFPEGTRNHGGGLLPFKKGAFNIAVQAGIPIIPCVISSYSHFYSKQERYFHIPGQVVVQIMEPVSTKQMTLEDVPALSENVRSMMMETYERISKEAAEMQKRLGERKKFQ